MAETAGTGPAPDRGDALGSGLIREAVRDVLLEAVKPERIETAVEVLRDLAEAELDRLTDPELAQRLSAGLTRIVQAMFA